MICRYPLLYVDEKFVKATERNVSNIRASQKELKQTVMRIGFELLQMKHAAEHLDENIYKISESLFGFGKTTTKNYVAVYEKFGSCDEPEQYDLYSMSQLVEMLPMDPDMIELCTPEMSKRSIRKLKTDLEVIGQPADHQIENKDLKIVPTSGQNETIDLESINFSDNYFLKLTSWINNIK